MSTTETLLDLAEHWGDLTWRQQTERLGRALRHLDEPTARSYAEEAAGQLRDAADIRDGVGDWRLLVARYLDDAATGLEDTAELGAAAEVARSLAVAALEAAVVADRAALARSEMDAAAELLDTLIGPTPDPFAGRDLFGEIEQSDAARDALERLPSPSGRRTA